MQNVPLFVPLCTTALCQQHRETVAYLSAASLNTARAAAAFLRVCRAPLYKTLDLLLTYLFTYLLRSVHNYQKKLCGR